MKVKLNKNQMKPKFCIQKLKLTWKVKNLILKEISLNVI